MHASLAEVPQIYCKKYRNFNLPIKPQ